MSHKLKSLLLASTLALSVSLANAATVTWNIVTTFQDLKGSITFDNAPIAGLVDGAFDGNDTHIYSSILKLSSVNLGINYTNANAYFQPLTNTYDNKHIDSCYSCNVASNIGSIALTFSDNSDQGSPATGVSDYYLFVSGTQTGTYRWAFSDDSGVNNGTNIPTNNVAEPSALALLGLGLLGVMGTRRKFLKKH